MYPQGYPYAPMPPPRRPSGMSPLVIVLIVLGVLLALGGGACALIGGILVGASAEPDPDPKDPALQKGRGNNAPIPSPAPGTDDNGGNANAPGTPPPVPAPAAAPAPAPAAVTPIWFCNASTNVMVCGFANVCSPQLVFGSGSGPDRFLASQQAKMACENMARARGAAAVCPVSCSVATKR